MKLSVTIPYTPYASKNRKFQWKSHKHLHPDYVKFVDDVITLVRGECNKRNLFFKDKTKTWVSLTLVKTSRMTKTDASNFLEAVCDGVKVAIKVDDCYYAGSFDWKLGAEPSFLLEVAQRRP